MSGSPWTNRVWQERHARRLTFAQKDVLLTLATYRGRGGSIHPSHETLAGRVGCCVRTVQRALEAAREIGLVSWCERRVRSGWRALRASNRYALTVPTMAAEPRPATTGLKVRAIFKRKILPVPSTPAVPVMDRAEAREALAAIRARLEERLLRNSGAAQLVPSLYPR
jgi:DNA-binding transcriptional MocR family regulator